MASGVIKNLNIGIIASQEPLINKSVLEYAKTSKSIEFVLTPSGMTDNPLGTGSFFHMILRRSTGRVIISSGLDSTHLYKNFSNTDGANWVGWRVLEFTPL